MSNDSNPFGSGYGAQTVSFGAGNPEPKTATPAAKPSVAPTGELLFGEAAGDSADWIKDTTTKDFSVDVIRASREQPVLVDFWAPWCGPCKQLTPVLEKAIRARKGAVRLVKLNIDDHPAIPGQMGVQSIPAVIAFKDGQPVDAFMGSVPESQINAFIDKLGAGDPAADAIADAMEQAQAMVDAGAIRDAAQIYGAILQQEPDHAAAAGSLAGLLLDAGQPDQARKIIARIPEDKRSAPEIAAVEARLALMEKLANLGDPAELEARLASNPKDFEARFDLAMIRNAADDRDGAADHLLAIMKADRTWREDGARKQLLEFFDAWGPADPATLSARRRLSSLLFS
jgi:putative thioredoxin